MPSELENAQTQLDATRAAILAVLAGGQSYGVDGHQSQKADLGELRKMEADLVSRIARLTRGGGFRMNQIVPL